MNNGERNLQKELIEKIEAELVEFDRKMARLHTLCYDDKVMSQGNTLYIFKRFLDLFEVGESDDEYNIKIINPTNGNKAISLLEKTIDIRPQGIASNEIMWRIPDNRRTHFDEPITDINRQSAVHHIAENLMIFYIIFKYDMNISDQILSLIWDFGKTMKPSIKLYDHLDKYFMQIVSGEYSRAWSEFVPAVPNLQDIVYTGMAMADNLSAVEVQEMVLKQRIIPSHQQRSIHPHYIIDLMENMSADEREEILCYFNEQGTNADRIKKILEEQEDE